jgi:thiamine biosynthesis lipoprotein
MRRRERFFFCPVVVLLVLLLAGCGKAPKDLHRSLFVFGTLLEIQAYSDETERFEQAVASLERMFGQMHKEWHAWAGEGELVRLNRALAGGDALEVSEGLAALLSSGQIYARQSEHMFNPALGRLIALWGFHADEPPGGAPPDSQAIAALLAGAPTMADLVLDGRRVGSRNPLLQLDLGAFAKGHALNLAIAELGRFGIRNAIVNAGGDLCVSGRHGERPWRIGIRHPQGQGVLASLDVSDGECVLTSGNYERYREFEGIRYAHILDPRSGYPVEHVASATVISRDGGLADAAATALSVAGPQAWQRIARRMALEQVMLVDEQGKVYLTPAMQARIRFQSEAPEVVVAEP